MTNFRSVSKLLSGRAFTFVEILVAIALVVFLAIPVYEMFMFAVRGSQKTGDLTLATAIGSEILELVKNKPFNSINPRDPRNRKIQDEMNEEAIQEFLKENLGNEALPVGIERFSRKLKIIPVGTVMTAVGEQPRFLKIVVEVYWQDKKTRSTKGPVVLATLVGNENARFDLGGHR